MEAHTIFSLAAILFGSFGVIISARNIIRDLKGKDEEER